MSRALLARQVDGEAASRPRALAGGLKISQPGDAFEREADRVADTVVSGSRLPGWSFAKVPVWQVQRQTAPAIDATQSAPTPAPQPNNYKEGAAKLGEAFLQTDIGKKLKDAAAQNPLTKGAKEFFDSLPGKIIAGTAAAGAVAAMAATHTPLPAQIPEIPLDKIRPGLKVKITYEGPVDHPTKAMVTFSFTPQGDKKKPAQTESERYRAETARMAAEMERFRAGMKYAPGSPQDLQNKAEEQAMQAWMAQHLGALPGTPGGRPLVPAPGLKQPADTGLKLPLFQSPFAPRAPHLLDKQLELKPSATTIATPQPDADAKKREETPVQRKALSNAEVSEDPISVREAVRSSGRPLDRETRRYMELRFGFDFSQVRVHTDSSAVASAKEVKALAYTVGSDVVFGSGQYAPHTEQGKRLLAHELTHTIQQQERPAAIHPGAGPRPAAPRKSAKSLAGEAWLRPVATEAVSAASHVIPLGEATANMRQAQDRRTAGVHASGSVRFRVPTAADLKALFTSGNVPQDVLKDRIQLALSRMASEKRLKSTDPVPDIMNRIFPAPGVFDEAAYAAAVDLTDRSKVYQSVLDAGAKVTGADKPKLTTVMQDAANLIAECIADAADLQSVFGTQKDVAKAVYVKAKAALLNAITHIDTNVTTDYNLDDPETGLGGWAVFATQKVHFRASVTKVTDEASAKITIIHEASHLADESVKDKGYYGTPGFEGKPEDEKVTNAAHYEEIPRRKLDKSKYKDPSGHFIDFKPGSSAAGAPLTFEEKVKGKAVEFFRKAWDKALDVNELIRDIRKDELAGNMSSFHAHQPRILEISKLMHLTVHEQPTATASINQVDVVIAEGVARAMGKMQGLARNQTVPNPFQLTMPPLQLGATPVQRPVLTQPLQLKPIPGLSSPQGPPVLQSEDDAANSVINATLLAHGNLTGNFFDDKALATWLVTEYKRPL